MYELSIQSWQEPVELIESGLLIVVLSPTYNVVIYTSYTQATAELLTGFCVQTLYKAVNLMASRDPGYYQSSNYVVKKVDDGEVPIGRILITNLDAPGVGSDRTGNVSISLPLTQSHEIDDLLAASKTTSSPTSTPTADSGEISDLDDPLFKIRYHFHGQKIPAGDILNAAIDGLALIAVFDHNAPCDSITALSHSRNVVWYVGQSSLEPLLAGEISKAYTLLIDGLLLVQRRFQEVWIEVFYDGENIADGYILKWNPSVEVSR